MSNLAFVNTLADTLSTTSIPVAMMFVSMIMVLPGVILGAYAKAYDAYKAMTSEDQDMLLGMSIISLGMGLVCMFALTNMNILVLATLAGLAAKEWSDWAADINEQDEQQILARNDIALENSFDQAMWRIQVTKLSIVTVGQIFDHVDARAQARKQNAEVSQLEQAWLSLMN